MSDFVDGKAASADEALRPRSVDNGNMRMPGVEPGSQAWEACMMPLHYMRLRILANMLDGELHPNCFDFACSELVKFSPLACIMAIHRDLI